MSIITTTRQLLAITVDAGQNNIPTLGAGAVWQNALNLIYFAAGAVSIIIMIVAGFRYVTSAGDAGSVAKAKNQILYGVVGLVIVMVAFLITSFVAGRVQG